jgi:hypothetical protein
MVVMGREIAACLRRSGQSRKAETACGPTYALQHQTSRTPKLTSNIDIRNKSIAR